jgi:uncharacterized protein YndB with AHSA1/START domain
MHRVEVERIIEAPPETVFARYTDHEGWSRWAGAGTIALAQEGTPDRNGVGCVREFRSAGGLREEVIEFHPPEHMAYRVVRGGFPIKDHRGDVRFEPHPRGTRLVWTVEFGSRVPFSEALIAGFLRRVFRTFLDRFERRGLA